MEYASLTTQMKDLAALANGKLTAFDVETLSYEEKELVRTLKLQLSDARLDVRDYEYAQTRVEQQQAATEGRQRLEQLQQQILKASEHNLLGAIDVAQLSALTQHIISELQ